MVKLSFIGLVLFLMNACGSSDQANHSTQKKSATFHHIAAFTSDSLVNVVIEIPAGTNQKWELNKTTGRIEWQQISADSLRIIDYLAYPANYGFVPQTLLSKDTGGDGDPVDVFVLGPAIPRETVVKAKIVAIIHMLDDGESDSKLLAVDVNSQVFKVNSLEALQKKYPGATDIIKLWLSNYKRKGSIEIVSMSDETTALVYLKHAHREFLKSTIK